MGRGRQVEPAGEHRTTAQHHAFVVAQQVVRPLHRLAQRLVAFQSRRAPDSNRNRSPRRSRTSSALIATIRAAANSIANAIPSRRRQISTTAADVGLEREPRVHRLGTFHEQLDRRRPDPGGNIQRRHRPQMLGADPQPLPSWLRSPSPSWCGPTTTRPGRRRRPARVRSCPTPTTTAGPTRPG